MPASRWTHRIPSLDELERRAKRGDAAVAAEAARIIADWRRLSVAEQAARNARSDFWAAQDGIREDHDIDRGETRRGY